MALRAVVDELEAIAEDAPSPLSVAVLQVGRLYLAASVGDADDVARAAGGLSVLRAILDSEWARLV